MKYNKWTYDWWKRSINQRLFSFQDCYDRMKLFSDNHTEEYQVVDLFMPFYKSSFSLGLLLKFDRVTTFSRQFSIMHLWSSSVKRTRLLPQICLDLLFHFYK